MQVELVESYNDEPCVQSKARDTSIPSQKKLESTSSLGVRGPASGTNFGKHDNSCISATEVKGNSGRGPIQLKVTQTGDEIAEQLLRGTFNARQVTQEAILKQNEETGVDQALPLVTERTSSQERDLTNYPRQQQHLPIVVPDLTLRQSTISPPAKENLNSSANHTTNSKLSSNTKMKTYLEILDSKYNRSLQERQNLA